MGYQSGVSVGGISQGRRAVRLVFPHYGAVGDAEAGGAVAQDGAQRGSIGGGKQSLPVAGGAVQDPFPAGGVHFGKHIVQQDDRGVLAGFGQVVGLGQAQGQGDGAGLPPGGEGAGGAPVAENGAVVAVRAGGRRAARQLAGGAPAEQIAEGGGGSGDSGGINIGINIGVRISIGIGIGLRRDAGAVGQGQGIARFRQFAVVGLPNRRGGLRWRRGSG